MTPSRPVPCHCAPHPEVRDVDKRKIHEGGAPHNGGVPKACVCLLVGLNAFTDRMYFVKSRVRSIH